MTVSWYSRYLGDGARERERERGRGREKEREIEASRQTCCREIEADTDRKKERWWCDSNRKGLCWRVAFSTILGYPVRVWPEKHRDKMDRHRHTGCMICAEANAHAHIKKYWMKEAPFGEGNSMVSIECVHDWLIYCSHVACVVFVWPVLIGPWGMTTTAANISYTNMGAHIILRYLECGLVWWM